ncbi:MULTISPECIES: LLM class flavin-dependent oxidoreductase [Methylobacterium]|jgi:FMN-dependent oxidoreductase (nitrilotriacetate monooxygenase family)|uniref:LLM class flavin-dependent oxidoreductase n=1 Tax=Methylobacterium TaxID=407 RepID=UPI0008E7F83E|nr:MULTISPECIES: LLM class flavin-dependent oxidoreductase [Methylobacterium]MBZ6415412.1 LLM class flavin-dependent oxidoreductase [Methylobacterium sp.]MBK3397004.1 LLM class flavin-dependent oxidoreductase [Methylobacterium ajmalii]MBK3412005.1 LLM class flavin-dependent oxidoreductase [Methylobacterium ajmalii]MBK3426455.1 LLM class flavin-dependent oxidoreductase [Methylobacterium ajmalii]SFF30272.1 FMN-dependent oxidoreductase, nitrilotriacetate monooxygenase family [Methylobacterium sp.
MTNGTMRLGAFFYATGHHVAGWRHPSSEADGGITLERYVGWAKRAEAAKFDLIFLEDGTGIRDADLRSSERTARSTHFEPVTLLSALAAVTSRIGLVATTSTSFNEPYNVARRFASLDHLSGGRAGWNLVTSATDLEAANFGNDTIARHADRYERAEEFVDVVLGLWNTWDDDAVVIDKASGQFSKPDGFRPLDHKGKHFEVRGPLNLSRTPQGQPVLVQAGSSGPGKDLAARTAEIVFTANQTLEEAVDFTRDLKGRMARFGRQPDDLKVMPGLFPVVGRSESEAREKFEELQALIDPVVGLALLSRMVGHDLSGHDPDGPVPELPESEGLKSRQQLMLDLARREGLSLRRLYLRIAGARGHSQIVGTPAQIVDEMEARFRAGGADGFNIMPPTLPGGLDDFIELVLPELRRRGLFRTEYEGTTLRSHLGSRPPGGHGPAR